MAYAAVQGKTNFVGNGNNMTVAFTSNNVLGNLLLCVVGLEQGNGANSMATSGPITDTQTNTWTKVTEFAQTGGGKQALFYAANCKAGANTITVKTTVSDWTTALIAEYSGLDTTAPFTTSGTVASGSVSGSNLTFALADALASNGAGDLVIAATYGIINSATPTSNPTGTNGYAARYGVTLNSGVTDALFLGDLSASGASVQSTTVTATPSTTSEHWSGVIASFKLASAGAVFIARAPLIVRQAVNRAATY